MSVSANIPALGNKITKDVPDQNALNQRMMRCDFSDVTDLPVGTKALVESAEGWEVRQFNGTSWVLLEKWNIDAQKVDGHSASTGTTANTIPVRDKDGKIPGDILGNATTASKAAALSVTNPIATGGTGATTAEQARENLGTPPKSHASGSTEYGAGSSTQYGHLKSHDSPDATLTAATGHAFSPAGAAAMQETLEGQIGDLAGVVSGNAAAQSAKDAAQDAAISAAKSSADAAKSSADAANAGLVGVVRKVNDETPDENGNLPLRKLSNSGHYLKLYDSGVARLETDGEESSASQNILTAATGAPMPITANRVGRFIRISGGYNENLVLPSGGTWAYYWHYTGAAETVGGAGIAAGGTVLATANASFRRSGFAWRIM